MERAREILLNLGSRPADKGFRSLRCHSRPPRLGLLLTGRKMRKVCAAIVSTFTCLVLVSQGTFQDAVARAPSRPNVLLILTDDQRVSSAAYHVMPKTMEIFREGGTKFRNGVVTTPLCCPSRASIFSGRYVHNHGVAGNEASNLDMSRTIQHQLRAAGYKTALSGKFFNLYSDNPPDFDRWAVHLRPALNDYFNAPFNVDGAVREVPIHATTFVKRRALEFLDSFEEQDEDPWFIQVSPYAPHTPATPQAKYADAPIPRWRQNPAIGERNVSDKPSFVQTATVEKGLVRDLRANQLRSLMSVDDLVADVFARLRELGEARTTLAFFLSDNGYMWYEHRLEGKRVPYNESVRVPYFVRWPGHESGGAVNPNIVANIDVAPTVYDATGVVPDYAVDGKSIWGTPRDHILLEHLDEHPQIPVWRALWNPTWEYIEYGNGGATREFYGSDDPRQLNNVYANGIAGDEPANEPLLKSQLAADSSCVAAACP